MYAAPMMMQPVAVAPVMAVPMMAPVMPAPMMVAPQPMMAPTLPMAPQQALPPAYGQTPQRSQAQPIYGQPPAYTNQSAPPPPPSRQQQTYTNVTQASPVQFQATGAQPQPAGGQTTSSNFHQNSSIGPIPNSFTPCPPKEEDEPECNGLPCKQCCKNTPTIQRRRMGTVGVVWCLFSSLVCLCMVPVMSDSCKDTDFICSKCQCKKKRVQAQCC